MRHFIENCNDNGFNNLRFTIADSLNNVEGLTDDETFFFSSSQKRKVLQKKIGHGTLWFKYQAWPKQKKTMRAWNVKPLDIENGYLYHKKAQDVENVNDFLIMIFLNTVFQTSYEKCFIVTREYVSQSWFCILQFY